MTKIERTLKGHSDFTKGLFLTSFFYFKILVNIVLFFLSFFFFLERSNVGRDTDGVPGLRETSV